MTSDFAHISRAATARKGLNLDWDLKERFILQNYQTKVDITARSNRSEIALSFYQGVHFCHLKASAE